MAATTQAASRPTRRRSGRRQQTLLTKLIRGVLGAVGVTLTCILLFAFMMQWLKPSDGVIRVVNQLIKLAAIFVGVRLAVGTGGERRRASDSHHHRHYKLCIPQCPQGQVLY